MRSAAWLGCVLLGAGCGGLVIIAPPTPTPQDCSPFFQNGLCLAGFECIAGVCRASCPGVSDDLCAAYEECQSGACGETDCSPQNPYGRCQEPLVCRDGACVTLEECSAEAPHGTCPPGEFCQEGQCHILPPCSAESPLGPCDDDTYCNTGHCVPYPCSLTHPQGTCGAGQECVSGECQSFPCSPTHPDGSCAAGYTCVQGTCIPNDCSPAYPNGVCPPGQECVSGACVPMPCSPQVPSGSCDGGQVCIATEGDPAFGQCRYLCSTDHTDGWCASGTECVTGSCLPSCASGIRCGPSTTCCTAGQECYADTCVEQCDPMRRCGPTYDCCAADESCRFDACIPTQTCTDDGECYGDAYCSCPSGQPPCSPPGECIPYGLDPTHPSTNPDCANLLVVGVFAPGHQCEWNGPTDHVAHCTSTCTNPSGDNKSCQSGLCVGCTSDDDCSTSEICEDGTCHTSCASGPSACASYETCSVVAPGTRLACYECLDRITDTDCYGGLRCVLGYCVDNYPNHTQVLSTPMVVDFDFDGNPETSHPSIVFVATDHTGGSATDCRDSGVIRVLDGNTCKTQFVVNRRRDDVYPAGSPRAGALPDARGCNSVAVADLDRTNPVRAEIVAHAATTSSANSAYGGLLAFRYDPAARGGRGAFSLYWHSTNAAGTAWDGACSDAGQWWAGPSIFDIDGNGSPEVMMAQYVYDATGHQLGSVSAIGNCVPYNNGIFPIVADLDGDGVVEWVDGSNILPWVSASHTWSTTNTQTTNHSLGQIAVADFGTYSSAAGTDDRTTLDGSAEVAKVRSGYISIQTLSGRNIRYGSPATDFVVSLGNGTGGPPTIADFDGDCRVEVAVASQDYYAVYDPDCDANPPALVSCNGVDDVSTCPTHGLDCADGSGAPCPKGVLWRVHSQDNSSNVTGSSVFDFEGDGRAEAVYADECFTRVYDGRSGSVVYSQYHSSCTWYENPVIADVDGDFNAEVVVPSNVNCSVNCSGSNSTVAASGTDARRVDSQFAGLRCKSDADCVGPVGSCQCAYGKDTDGNCNDAPDPIDVEVGLCTCTTDADCGPTSSYFICADHNPDARYSYLGSQKVCRSYRPGAYNGILVYRDVLDRWVDTRRIWSQNAYSITHILEDGTVQPASLRNWVQPHMNNFRENLLGDANPEHSPDATAAPMWQSCQSGEGSRAGVVYTRICNRGTASIGEIPVSFYVGDPANGGTLLCRLDTGEALAPGQCTELACNWPAPETQLLPSCPVTEDIYVRADDDGTGDIGERECLESNNIGILKPN